MRVEQVSIRNKQQSEGTNVDLQVYLYDVFNTAPKASQDLTDISCRDEN